MSSDLFIYSLLLPEWRKYIICLLRYLWHLWRVQITLWKRHIGPPSTYWGRVTHICVSKLAIFDLDNGLSPGRRQAIIWTNVGILLIRTVGTNFSEILNSYIFFKKLHLKITSAKWRPFCLGLKESDRQRPLFDTWRQYCEGSLFVQGVMCYTWLRFRCVDRKGRFNIAGKQYYKLLVK